MQQYVSLKQIRRAIDTISKGKMTLSVHRKIITKENLFDSPLEVDAAHKLGYINTIQFNKLKKLELCATNLVNEIMASATNSNLFPIDLLNPIIDKGSKKPDRVAPINKNDINDLKIALNTAKNFDELFKLI